MGHTVTVTGTLVAVSGLPGRDEQRTVEVTDRVRRLVRQGYLAVVEGSLNAPAEPEPSEADEPISNSSVIPVDPNETPEPVRPPGRNASRDTWAAFLDNQSPPIEYPADADRGQLQHIWNQSLGDS